MCVCVCLHVFVYVYARACVGVCLRVCVWQRVCVCVSAHRSRNRPPCVFVYNCPTWPAMYWINTHRGESKTIEPFRFARVHKTYIRTLRPSDPVAHPGPPRPCSIVGEAETGGRYPVGKDKIRQREIEQEGDVPHRKPAPSPETLIKDTPDVSVTAAVWLNPRHDRVRRCLSITFQSNSLHRPGTIRSRNRCVLSFYDYALLRCRCRRPPDSLPGSRTTKVFSVRLFYSAYQPPSRRRRRNRVNHTGGGMKRSRLSLAAAAAFWGGGRVIAEGQQVRPGEGRESRFKKGESERQTEIERGWRLWRGGP